MSTHLSRQQRADAVRPLVRAEYDRLRGEVRMSSGDALTVMGIHLREVSEKMDKPLVSDAYGSVQHLISGHDGAKCKCRARKETPCVDGVPVGYTLDAFEAAAQDYPIPEPKKLRAAERKPVVSKRDPLAALIASGAVSRPRRGR
jgi:hypothetical protein